MSSLVTAALIASSIAVLCQTDAAKVQDAATLRPGQRVEQTIDGGEFQTYRIALTAGQYLRIDVEQISANVVVAINGPDGTRLADMSRINGLIGIESLSVLAETTGEFRLVVRTNPRSLPGRYAARIKELRDAMPLDRRRIAGEAALTEGWRLWAPQTDEAERRALDKLREARQLLHETGDRREEATALARIASIHNTLFELQQAVEHNRLALTLSREVGDRAQEINVLFQMAQNAYVVADWQRAQDHYRQAIDVARQVGDRFQEALSLDELAACLIRVGEHEKALAYLAQEGVLRKTFERGDSAGLARNLGEVHLAAGEYRKAIEHFEQTLHLRGQSNDRRGQAGAHFSLGNSYSRMGDTRAALDHYQTALTITRALNWRPLEATTLKSLGDLHLAMSQDAPAREAYDLALALNLDMRRFDGEAQTLSGLARLERQRGNLGEARALMERALAFFESSRAKLVNPDQGASYRSAVQRDYEFFIALLMEMDRREPAAGHGQTALRASESSRARSLVELLHLSGIDPRRGVDPLLSQRDAELRSRFSRLHRQFVQEGSKDSPDRQRLAGLETALRRTEDDRELIVTEIRRRHRQYAGLQFPAPLDLPAIQRLLDEETALLEYSVGSDSSFLFAVTNSGFLATRVPPASALLSRVNTLRTAIAGGPNRRLFGTYRREARALFEELIRPAHALIAGKRRLIIVPDGGLHYLPFEVLLSSDDAAAEASRLPYLLRDYAISYVPSASVLAGLRESGSAARGLLAFADPIYDERVTDERRGGDGWQSRMGGLTVVQGLRRLTASRQEVTGIGKLFPSEDVRLLLGPEASEQAAKNGDLLSRARYVHFAVHGVLDENRPQYSGLVLSQDEGDRTELSRDSAEDGLLQVHEVFDLQLNADLVVLSACGTGLGRRVTGEGLIGLTRAVLYAGAPSVVVSLWSVADRSTADLMVRLYQHLSGAPGEKAEALRQAQLDLIRSGVYSHPYYWAPFVLVGRH